MLLWTFMSKLYRCLPGYLALHPPPWLRATLTPPLYVLLRNCPLVSDLHAVRVTRLCLAATHPATTLPTGYPALHACYLRTFARYALQTLCLADIAWRTAVRPANPHRFLPYNLRWKTTFGIPEQLLAWFWRTARAAFRTDRWFCNAGLVLHAGLTFSVRVLSFSMPCLYLRLVVASVTFCRARSSW
jgi:hypothetical protein